MDVCSPANEIIIKTGTTSLTAKIRGPIGDPIRVNWWIDGILVSDEDALGEQPAEPEGDDIIYFHYLSMYLLEEPLETGQQVWVDARLSSSADWLEMCRWDVDLGDDQ